MYNDKYINKYNDKYIDKYINKYIDKYINKYIDNYINHTSGFSKGSSAMVILPSFITI